VSESRARLVEHPLDERARVYVRGQLELDLHLCRSLLPVFDGEPGRFYTIAPDSASHEQLHQFTGGGLYPEDWSAAVRFEDGSAMVPAPRAYSARARPFRALLQQSPTAFCLVDDFMESGYPTDDGSVQPPSRLFIQQDAYCFITAENEAEELEAALRRGDEIWHGVAASYLPPLPVSREAIGTFEALAECAAFVREISVTAYDAEGFVAWTRS
jgi:hypothetical protein